MFTIFFGLVALGSLCLVPPVHLNPLSTAYETNAIFDDDDYKTIDLSHFGNSIFGIPNELSGDRVASWTEDSNVNPEELGDYAEGDILVPLRPASRSGVIDESMHWPRGIIPYTIEGFYNQQQLDTIKMAIADYHRLTCLRFVQHTDQADYLAIQSQSTGCWSSVGRIGGRQELNLQAPGCVTKKGTVQHELLHAVGFIHEQSRPDRDSYVDIAYNNVKSGSEGNFQKSPSSAIDDYGAGYDYSSVMHYSEYAFSKNGQKTVVPKSSDAVVGQRDGLSKNDVKRLNNMYGCSRYSEPAIGWVGNVYIGLYNKNNYLT